MGDLARFGAWPKACLVLVLLSAACAERQESTAHKCARFREHVLDLRSEGLPVQDRAQHRSALAHALGEQFEDECKALSTKQIDCALAASDIVASAECAVPR